MKLLRTGKIRLKRVTAKIYNSLCPRYTTAIETESINCKAILTGKRSTETNISLELGAASQKRSEELPSGFEKCQLSGSQKGKHVRETGNRKQSHHH